MKIGNEIPEFEEVGTITKYLAYLIFAVAIAMLLYTERTSISMQKAYGNLGDILVENVDTTELPVKYNGKLLYFGAFTRITDTIADPIFGVGGKYLAVRRTVEYYQWVEHKYTEKTKYKDETETKTYYEYSRAWVNAPVNSAEFEEKGGHENVAPLTIEPNVIYSPNVKMGAYTVGSEIMNTIARCLFEESAAEIDFEMARKPLVKSLVNKKIHLTAGSIFYGDDPEAPQVGDVRVNFDVASPSFLYVMAMAEKGTLKPYAFQALDHTYSKVDTTPFNPRDNIEFESDGYTYLSITCRIIAWLLIVWAVHWLRALVVEPVRRLPYVSKCVPNANNSLTLWIVGTYVAIVVIVVCYLFARMTT